MNDVKISFLIRINKINQNGKCPIYTRLTVNGRRAEIATKKYVIPSKWNASAQKVKGNSPGINAINRYLEQIKRKALEAEIELIKEGINITAKSLKEAIAGTDDKKIDLLDLFKEHNSKMKELIGKDFSESTYKKYSTCLKHLKQYVKGTYDQSYYPLRSVNLAFIKGFEHYLKTKDKPCSHNTALKYMSHLKKIINEAVALEYISKNPFKGYKETYNTKDPEYLTNSELRSLRQKEFKIDRVQRVKDIFLFSCYTGLSYSDVEKLKKTDIQTGDDGEKWLIVKRTKTKEPSFILLLDIPLAIISKYMDDPETRDGNLLPVLSNQKMNAYLKEVADLCGIQKNLTFHMARHTFATTVALENGVSISTVQKILGHKDSRSTQHYARVTRKKVGDEMKVLRTSLS
jgi:site-specific recombinase XerD